MRLNDLDLACRNLKFTSIEERNRASACHSTVEQIRADVGRALSASDDKAPGRLSARAVVLKELAEKWIRPTSSAPTAVETESDLAAVMSRRVTAVELKAGLTDLWAQRMQRSCKYAVSKKQDQATQLLRENNSLRKENKRLRDQLSLGSVDRKQATALDGQEIQPVVDIQMHPPARHGLEPATERRHSLETVDEHWAEHVSGTASALGSRAAPSRPTSAKLSEHASGHRDFSRRSSSARPYSARLGATRSGQAQPQLLKRPLSAQLLGRNGRPLGAAGRAAMMPLTTAAQGLGHGTPHAVAQLREQSESQASLIEDQQAELQLLKAMLHERAMQGHNGNDEEEEDGDDLLEADSDQSALEETLGKQCQQQDLTSTQHAGQLAKREFEAHGENKKMGKKRRPTSAGGVGVERARQVLQFHGRSNGR